MVLKLIDVVLIAEVRFTLRVTTPFVTLTILIDWTTRGIRIDVFGQMAVFVVSIVVAFDTLISFFQPGR